MSDWDFIYAPSTVSVTIERDEVGILLNSMRMLNADEFHDGLHEWVSRTVHAMPPEKLRFNMIASHHLYMMAHKLDANTIPDLVTALRDVEPERLVDNVLGWMREKPDYPGDAAMIADEETYVAFVSEAVAEKYARRNDPVNVEEIREEWQSLQDLPALRDQIADHLQWLWDTYLSAEWNRVRPIVDEAVSALRAVDFSGMSAYAAIEAVTGRNMRGYEYLEENLAQVDKIIFIPNPHLGPYISWNNDRENRHMVFFVGVRQTKNSPTRSIAISRSELLVRLNALADETRLKMLELLTHHNELCAQDFINQLDLSQSSASRHLRQLTASGYINERRRDVAKCYSLNTERIDDTIRALKDFLS